MSSSGNRAWWRPEGRHSLDDSAFTYKVLRAKKKKTFKCHKARCNPRVCFTIYLYVYCTIQKSTQPVLGDYLVVCARKVSSEILSERTSPAALPRANVSALWSSGKKPDDTRWGVTLYPLYHVLLPFFSFFVRRIIKSAPKSRLNLIKSSNDRRHTRRRGNVSAWGVCLVELEEIKDGVIEIMTPCGRIL